MACIDRSWPWDMAAQWVAPSLIPRRPGERVKTNRRDALSLVRLLRAAELTVVWVPDETREAIRDLVRTRAIALEDYRRKRQHISAFLLRHGRAYEGGTTWKGRHLRWLDGQNFAHAAQRFAFQEMLNAMRAAVERIDRLDAALAEIVPAWTMAPVVAAFQAMRGVGFHTATAVVAEAGDLRRFEHPRQLMAFLGLVPSERSTGDTRRQGGITKTGNRSARKGTGRSALDLSTFRRSGNDTPAQTKKAAATSLRDRTESSEPSPSSISMRPTATETARVGDAGGDDIAGDTDLSTGVNIGTSGRVSLPSRT
jgi:transposase